MQIKERVVALVPEAGSDCGWSVVKSMMRAYDQQSQPELIFTDADPNSPALQYRDTYQVPRAENEQEYLDAVLRIVDMLGVNIILPTSDFDAKVIMKHRRLFHERGVILALSPLETIELMEDKLLFAEEQPYIHPVTTNDSYRMKKEPFFAKPRKGVGSRGVQIVRNRLQAEALEQGDEPYIFQELLTGTQCTVDVLCDFTGTPLQAVTREVRRLKGGSDVVCKIVQSPKMEEIAMKLCEHYGVIGAACFEFMFGTDGEPLLIDAQPRLSGSHVITTLAGLNIPYWILQLAQGEDFQPQEIRYGLEVVRQLQEEII